MIELLVAVTLSLLIALAISSLWLGLQRSQVEAADRVSALVLTRVVASRLEKDVRHATLAQCVPVVISPVLRADQNEIVILSASRGQGPELVEWEVNGGNLMRRHGPWTGVVPPRSQHQAYTSSKTMLEGVSSATRFGYLVGGMSLPQVDDADLQLVTGVALEGELWAFRVSLAAYAEVGR
jgi:hypothetical protein